MQESCLEVTSKIIVSIRSLLDFYLGVVSKKEGIYHNGVPIDVS